MASEEKLKNEINQLIETLDAKKNELFNLRLFNMIGKNEEDLKLAGICNVRFTNDDDEWNISYTHEINCYNENDYINSIDSETETTPLKKSFLMTFGKGKKYYIRGNGTRFKIYKNSKNDLRIINVDYDIELDLDEQETLIEKYSENLNIPEWLAIKVFKYMSENDWSDENIISYMSFI